MDLLNSIFDLFSGGTVTVVLKLVLGVLVLGGFVWLVSWIEKQAREQAHNDTEKDRNEQQSNIGEDNKEIFNDAKNSEQSVEDMLNKRLGGK